jgi:NAD(P)-dependent dehydrogenase (short-subunit alcohol dehydrogenase family)
MVRTQFDVNVIGLVLATQAALPALTASKGSIINIGSAAGHKPVPGGSIYGATKAAVESLTKSWAVELAPKGVRVNAVCPGPTETPGFEKLPIPPEMVPAVKAQFTAQVPLGRMASTEEIAKWILHIADPSVTWMTGEILAIDGGMSLS